ncbi:MAG: DEAD/DEAH box helicase [Eubacteriales bacterium]|nr:DEAD/DEAH box helicase [Eubacteriales bacterium]
MNYTEQLTPAMQETLKQAGYITPTPIQEMTLPLLMDGQDLIGVAQTGTGKTAAFAIPIIERAFQDNRRTQALVLCPTRELAMQTAEVFHKLSAHKKLRIVSVYGGQSANVQIRALRAGAQIIVGTPGRVKDLIGRNVIKLQNVRFSVLDEADEMLDFGFLPDIKSILANITGKHQTMLFSATMSNDIAQIAKQFLTDPQRVEAGVRNEPTKTVRQMCIRTEDGTKLPAINQLLKEAAPRLTLIFCNTRRRVKNVTEALNKRGTKTACLHGDLSQNQRDAVMRTFRSGENRVLVATDVAARGIDVDNVDLVINYDVPDKPEYYVHRIGRTGRAGKTGLACTLVNAKDHSNLLSIRKKYHVLMA